LWFLADTTREQCLALAVSVRLKDLSSVIAVLSAFRKCALSSALFRRVEVPLALK